MADLEAIPNLDALDAGGPSPDPRWLEWMGYSQKFSTSNLLETLNELAQQPPQPLTSRIGYLGNAQSSFNQLRLGAEAAIATGDWTNARELLCQVYLLRPSPRRRSPFLGRAPTNPLLRQIALLISYRKLKCLTQPRWPDKTVRGILMSGMSPSSLSSPKTASFRR